MIFVTFSTFGDQLRDFCMIIYYILRVFSLLKSMFSENQDSALADLLQGSRMLSSFL